MGETTAKRGERTARRRAGKRYRGSHPGEDRKRDQPGAHGGDRRPAEGLCGDLHPLRPVLGGLPLFSVPRPGPALLAGGQGQADAVGDAEKARQGEPRVHQAGAPHLLDPVQLVQALRHVLPLRHRRGLPDARGPAHLPPAGCHPALHSGHGPQPLGQHEPDVGQGGRVDRHPAVAGGRGPR